MIINLPYKVDITVNTMYYQRKNGKFLKPEALRLRARIIEDVKAQVKNFEFLLEDMNERLTIAIIMTENWYYKNGSIRKSDLDNRLKFLIDSIFRGLDMDDKMIFEIYAKKEQSELAECVEIDIRELKYD